MTAVRLAPLIAALLAGPARAETIAPPEATATCVHEPLPDGSLGPCANSEEIVAALIAAPWWSSAYYNLAVVAEKMGHVTDAIGCLKLYLLANPKAPDAQAAQDKIYALEVKAERAR